MVPVLLFHGGFWLFEGGYLGVDVFFVISGFLITGNLLRDLDAHRLSLLGFYERRVRRLFPALFAVMTVTTVAAMCLSFPLELKTFGYGLVGAFTHTANIIFHLTTGYWGPSNEQNPALHTWSLSVEEQFYMLFPLGLMLAHRAHRRGPEAFVLLSFAASLAFAVAISGPAAFFLLPSRAFELMVGSASALWVRNTGRRPDPRLAALGLAVVMVSILTFDRDLSAPGVLTLFPCVGTALVLVFGSAAGLAGALLTARPIVFVGLISYSLYLWHQPVLAFARQAHGFALDTPWVLLMLAFSFLPAWASWRWVEQPWRDRVAVPPRRVWTSWFAGTGLAVVVGIILYVSNGLPGRLGPEPMAYLLQNPRYSDRCGNGDCRKEPAPTVVLWGDSHAGALVEPARSWAAHTRQSFALAGGAGCSAQAPEHELQKCRTANKAGRRKADTAEVVVLSARWAARAGLAGKACEVTAPLDLHLPEGSNERTVQLVRELVAAGKQVVVVGQVPEPRCSPSDLGARYAFWGMDLDLDTVGLSRDDARVVQTTLRDFYRQAEEAGAMVVDPVDILCEPARCPVQSSPGTLLFGDDNHLTTVGAERVWTRVAAALQ
ncbi:MAG: acyltransferase [Alphaproteobacteria bacterium]|nr:acyltransferase [Alphaproteobacteria bacterium]